MDPAVWGLLALAIEPFLSNGEEGVILVGLIKLEEVVMVGDELAGGTYDSIKVRKGLEK